MLDQNTTLLIASTITVIGTLGGAISGVVLTNHHSTKLEKLKIEQEKLKRKVTAQPPCPCGTKASKGLSARKEFGRVSS